MPATYFEVNVACSEPARLALPPRRNRPKQKRPRSARTEALGGRARARIRSSSWILGSLGSRARVGKPGLKHAVAGTPVKGFHGSQPTKKCGWDLRGATSFSFYLFGLQLTVFFPHGMRTETLGMFSSSSRTTGVGYCPLFKKLLSDHDSG